MFRVAVHFCFRVAVLFLSFLSFFHVFLEFLVASVTLRAWFATSMRTCRSRSKEKISFVAEIGGPSFRARAMRSSAFSFDTLCTLVLRFGSVFFRISRASWPLDRTNCRRARSAPRLAPESTARFFSLGSSVSERIEGYRFTLSDLFAWDAQHVRLDATYASWVCCEQNAPSSRVEQEREIVGRQVGR